MTGTRGSRGAYSTASIGGCSIAIG